jgi:nucleoside-diphosphate-sugar epimerase
MLLIFGLGYCGRAVAHEAAEFDVTATSRSGAAASLADLIAHADPPPPSPSRSPAMSRRLSPLQPEPAAMADAANQSPGAEMGSLPRGLTPRTDRRAMTLVPFEAAEPAIAAATHILVTAPPDAGGDPVLNRYAVQIAAAPGLQWIGYLSSTVVYGDRGGAWVDEDTPPAPSQPRGQRRLDAELAWSRLATGCSVDIFRLAGIYGPGRSAFDDLRAGTARRMSKPGHQFSRIHRDDIGRAAAAAMRQVRAPGRRILNLADDRPSESAAVVIEAARLMGVAPPPEIAFADVLPAISPMARSFWAENRKVASEKTQRSLGLRWLYPSFREGLAAIWREESGDRTH